jgi:4,5-dihydroxyphthalate decarboxylase
MKILTAAEVPWVVAEAEESERIFANGDIWPFGVEANRKTIQQLIDYLRQDGLLERDQKFGSTNRST